MPAVGGYEGVGEIHSLGPAVKGLSPGDWVIPSPPSFGKTVLLTFISHGILSLMVLIEYVACMNAYRRTKYF